MLARNGGTDTLTKLCRVLHRESGVGHPGVNPSTARPSIPPSLQACPWQSGTQTPVKKSGSTAVCSHNATNPDGWIPLPRCTPSEPGRQIQKERETHGLTLPSRDVPRGKLTCVQRGRESGRKERSLGTRTSGGHRGVFAGKILHDEPTVLHPPHPALCYSHLLRRPAPLRGAERQPHLGGACRSALTSRRYKMPAPALVQSSGCPPGKTPSSPLPSSPLAPQHVEEACVTPSDAGSAPQRKAGEKDNRSHS